MNNEADDSLQKHSPIVSIVIPVYNDAEHIAGAIGSALAQTLKDIEVIVVDDGSTDNVADVVGAYEGRITMITQQNKGESAVRSARFMAFYRLHILFLNLRDVMIPGIAR